MGNPCVPATPSPITAINKWSPAPPCAATLYPSRPPKTSLLRASRLSLNHALMHTPPSPPLPPLRIRGSICAGGHDAGAVGAQTTCTLAGQPTAAGTSPSVYCNPAGLVLEMYTRLLAPPLSAAQPAPFRTSISCLVLTGGKASGSFPSHVSKLSALTKL
ncbi:unnamed protein product [Closterium sp. NIES-64]|nr:unnamed protein product [Closterium sp. NIES-64]